MRLIRLAALLASMIWMATSSAENLCADREVTVLSFQETRFERSVSLCKATGSKYLVYRFGTKADIELQYPPELDERSWEKFDFAGRRRGGGKGNAAFGDYSLSFVNGNAEYVIFQKWSDEDKTYSVGINIRSNKKSVTLLGDRKTQQGSLVLLESESKKIRNTADE